MNLAVRHLKKLNRKGLLHQNALNGLLHYSLLEVSKLVGGQGVSLANDRDDVDSGAEALHQLEINFSEANIEQKKEERAQGSRTRTLLATEEATKHRKEILRALFFFAIE